MTSVQPIEFETPRLILRQWRPSDRPPFAALNADPGVMAHFPAALDRETSDAIADRCQALIAEQGWGLWAVEVKDTSEFIGFVGLHIPSTTFSFSPCIEISWRLTALHWGKGFATEAANAVLKTGFEQLGLEKIVSFTALSNLRSQAVMARIGMQREPESFDHPDLPAESRLRKHCLYTITPQTWSKRHKHRDSGL